MSELHEATRKIRSLWTAQEERKRRAQRTGKWTPPILINARGGHVSKLEPEPN